MVVATKYENLLVAYGDTLRLLQLLPDNINFDRFQGEVMYTEVLTFLDCLLLIVETSHYQNSLIESAKDA